MLPARITVARAAAQAEALVLPPQVKQEPTGLVDKVTVVEMVVLYQLLLLVVAAAVQVRQEVTHHQGPLALVVPVWPIALQVRLSPEQVVAEEQELQQEAQVVPVVVAAGRQEVQRQGLAEQPIQAVAVAQVQETHLTAAATVVPAS